MSKKKITIIGSISLTIIISVVVFFITNGNSDQIEVQTEIVKRDKLIQTVSAIGKIQPKTRVKISADVSAKITRLGVKEGNWVKKGDFLVELERERYIAAVERTEAALRSTKANAKLAMENMKKAEKDYVRTKELFDKKLESQAVLDAVYAQHKVENARYEAAMDQVEQSRASLKQTKDDLSKTTIYSPMSGTVSLLNKEIGEIALGSQFQEDVIMVISDLNSMEAIVDVDENDIVSVEIGDTASIEVDALPNKQLKGIVSEIANSAKISGEGTTDQKTEFEVKISIEGETSRLRPGMTATSDIITDIKENILIVPIQSVTVRTPKQLEKKSIEKDSGFTKKAIADNLKEEFMPNKDGFVEIIWVIDDENNAHAKQVKTGIQSDTNIEIISGISEGNLVVTGSYRAISKELNNNTQVKIKNSDNDK